MIILAIDTSTMTGSVAITEDRTLLAEITLNIRETHESRLMKTIDSVFQATKLTPQEIDLFAVGVGPGSFTGLRISLATVKALALATQKPVVGISSLKASAARFFCDSSFFCPILDARKGEIYTALFRRKEQQLEQLLPDTAIAPQQAFEQIKEITRDQPILFWGSGSLLYKGLIEECFAAPAVFPPLIEPSGATVAYLGWQKWQQTKQDELQTILPNYLRKSEAEIKWAARSNQ